MEDPSTSGAASMQPERKPLVYVIVNNSGNSTVMAASQTPDNHTLITSRCLVVLPKGEVETLRKVLDVCVRTERMSGVQARECMTKFQQFL